MEIKLRGGKESYLSILTFLKTQIVKDKTKKADDNSKYKAENLKKKENDKSLVEDLISGKFEI